MKKILFSAVSALTLVAVAGVDSTEFGVLYVPSTDKETIVSVPWLESGTGNDPVKDAVKVSDLVLTAGLEAYAADVYEGDQLMYYPGSGTTYQCWVLKMNGQGVKQWEAGSTVTALNVTPAPNADAATLARGQAIILKRNRDGISSGFYIMGKPAASEAGSINLPSGTAAATACALIAPSKTTATQLGAMKWDNLATRKDYVVIGMDMCMWDGTKWKLNGADVSTREIPAGEGVWFVSRGAGPDKDKQKQVSWQ